MGNGQSTESPITEAKSEVKTAPAGPPKMYRAPKDSHTESIKQLILLRNRGFPVLEMKRITPEGYAAIRALSADLGMRITYINLEATEKLKTHYPKCQQKYHQVLEAYTNVMEKNPSFGFGLLRFSSDLLQFYTLKCDQAVHKKPLTAESFRTLREEKKDKFGDTTENLLVIENQLILVYNDLARLEDQVRHTPAKAFLAKLDKLTSILHDTASLLKQNSNHIFCCYLSLVSHYSYAKAAELEFMARQATLGREIMHQFSLVQQKFLQDALEDVTRIQETRDFIAARGSTAPAIGEEYLLGQELFHSLPFGGNLTAVSKHLRCLLQTS
jgi:hypothetical protein